MRVVVVGATGNVGLATVRALQESTDIHEVVGIARRAPSGDLEGARWVEADVTRDDLVPCFEGADAVIHLAWSIQPVRDLARLWATNVEGSQRVFDAVAAAGVPTLVYASSVGAYSPGPNEPVDESWPTHGIETSAYSRQKAYVERLVDLFEAANPAIRVVRLRPALIFQRESAEAQRRLFLGPLVPPALLRPGRLPVFPDVDGVRFQAVHSDDVADAYLRAVTSEVRGAFNIAAEPVLSTAHLAAVLGARPVAVPRRLARPVVAATWHARLHPISPGWYDLAVRSPLLDTSRARTELGWSAQHDATDAVRALLTGIADRRGGPTPPLQAGQRARRDHAS